MVVNQTRPTGPPAGEVPDPATLDLASLAWFLGLRANAVVREALVARGFRDVRESHGFVVQHLVGGDRTISELARRMGVTQQAASKVVTELAAAGVVDLAPADDRRAKRVRLSARGRRAVTEARAARRRVDRRLVRALGPDAHAGARRAMVDALRALGGLEAIAGRRVPAPR